MKPSSFGPAFKQMSPWTCRRCLQRAQRVASPLRQYSTKSRSIPIPKKRGRILLAATTATLGVTALEFGDDVKHTYKAVERTGRVLGTLAVCINE